MRNTPANRNWVTTERAHSARGRLLVIAIVVGILLWRMPPLIEEYGGGEWNRVLLSLMFALSIAGVFLIFVTALDLMERLDPSIHLYSYIYDYVDRGYKTGFESFLDVKRFLEKKGNLSDDEKREEWEIATSAAHRLMVVLGSLGIGIFIGALSPEAARTYPLRDQILNLIRWLGFCLWFTFSIVSAYLIWVTILDAFDARCEPSD